uniref:iron-sulfur cluster formation ABC transporter n=1 Tax=Sargassum siliquastrum TaxID=127572 RepID=UPI0020795A6B|nr:iron-sulfur cluster formation ABC transporter [Sargassum siliquastrum]YP_010485385.1 iron-sulfur cluster formation ABC transporter ATP-binding subunit [Sargassum macrocarpum]YP_010485524.1 iron-sulfur cluster formation ABC transporter ATP-binding subunit [Sargassum serratifolium]URP30962.1 iron-sulfur cluster formation ABC transporter [Sargassum siliquastrum]UVW81318.1 iron-sulfur cluster formation ABC transporter ATP-binding subunit [Sargassum macrocarpum]UVW81457.1 iron-sulfur cluster for
MIKKTKLPLLEIKNLHANIDDSKILKGINLSIFEGEVHAIMGVNGSGKSTLSKVIAGHPSYSITKGEILFEGKDISDLEPDLRSHLGLFLAFQYPIEIAGVDNQEFLAAIYNAKQLSRDLPKVNPLTFYELVKEKLKMVKLDERFISRNVNEGFSGGEKKRNEILQFALLDSKVGILDETDSGLDIDALKSISETINTLIKKKNKSIILITHYKRLLEYIKPDFIHIMDDGKIVKTGDSKIANILEEKGYDWIKK